MIFWDTSALLRCHEPGMPAHARAVNLLKRSPDQAGSDLLRLEIYSGLRRMLGRNRAKMERAWSSLGEFLSYFTLSRVDEPVLERAIRLIDLHALRAADAIHVSSALLLQKELGRRQFHFATLDAEQAAAAKAEGLKVLLIA